MDLTERLKFLISANADDAVRAFQKAGAAAEKELGKADDRISKLQASFTKFGAGAMAFAGVAAAGMVKLAGKFEDTALAAGKLADATGLTVEQASKYNEVAADLGIGTDALATMFKTLAKEITNAPKALQSIGAEIVKTSTGATDMSATFLSVVDALNRIQDPAKQDTVAAQLLGRGWQSAAELVKEGSATITDSLAAVSDAKTINPEELAKAKQYRDALDALGDSAEDLAIVAGEDLAPSLASIATGLANIIEHGKPVIDVMGKIIATALGGDAKSMSKPIEKFMTAVGNAPGDMAQMLLAFQDLRDSAAMNTSSLGKTTEMLGVLGDYLTGAGADGARAGFQLDQTRKAIDQLAASSPAAAASVVSMLEQISQNAQNGNREAQAWMKGVGLTADAVADLAAKFGAVPAGVQDTAYAIADAETVVLELQMALEDMIQTLQLGQMYRDADKFGRSLEQARQHADDAAAAVHRIDTAWKTLTGELDRQQAALSLKSAFDDLGAAGVEALTKTKKHAKDAKDAQDAYAKKLLDTKQQVLDYAKTVDGLPQEEITKIFALIDQGKLDEAKRTIAELTTPVTVTYKLKYGGQLGGIAQDFPTVPIPDPSSGSSSSKGKTKSKSGNGKSAFIASTPDGGTIQVDATGGSGPVTEDTSTSSTTAAVTSEADRMRNMYRAGAISGAQYREFLAKQLSGLEQFTNEWADLHDQIAQVDQDAAEAERTAAAQQQQAADDEAALWKAQFETGTITAQQYEQLLAGRLATQQQWSTDYMATWRELHALEDADAAAALKARQDALKADEDAQKAHDDEIAAQFARARARQKADEEAATADQAMGALSAADAALKAAQAGTKVKGKDGKYHTVVDPEEIAKAQDDLVKAMQDAAKALFDRADANAVRAGGAQGSVDWARMVRAEIEQDIANAPVLGGPLGLLLEGVPQLAKGGVVKATPGGRAAIIAEGGQDEIVSPVSTLDDMFGRHVDRMINELGGTIRGALGRARVIENLHVSTNEPMRSVLTSAMWRLTK